MRNLRNLLNDGVGSLKFSVGISSTNVFRRMAQMNRNIRIARRLKGIVAWGGLGGLITDIVLRQAKLKRDGLIRHSR